ncbi:hypothetical protein [Massilia sp. IC2-476]|uniref:hypothetical protein n=1 Tax=Massilia sp. IC2-476 TaxID=2887199 RepID=UPI001D11CFEF|nr:hypothetical protein [Massilia sp. IC2-476]MCC2971718.1 hypothetical protein [Massilia sp. IC2-476]
MHRAFIRLILMTVILSAGPWQAAQAASPFAREVPTTYPRFEEAAGSLSLVVAELVATDYLKGYDCPKSQARADGSTTVVICMDPPPTWFKAHVLQHVAGADIGGEFYAVTGSHYGAMKVGAAEPARLMLLRSNGSALEMLRYRSWPVATSRDGQYHLIVQGGPIHWLPCWSASLMREIEDGDFAADLAITREEYDSRWAERHASFYRVSADSVRPRYAIPVAGLQQRLKNLPLAAADFSCTKQTPAS